MHADNIYLQSKDNPQLAPNAERVAELKHHAVELYKLHRMKQTKGRIGRDPDEVQSLLQAASRYFDRLISQTYGRPLPCTYDEGASQVTLINLTCILVLP